MHVAGLAAVTLPGHVTEARSEYKGLEGLENLPPKVLVHRKGLYSGVRRLVKGRAGPDLDISKVKGHVDPEGLEGHDRHLA